MARKEEATLIFKIKTSGTKALKGIAGGVVNIGKKIMGIAIPALAAMGVGIAKLALDAEKAKDVEAAFANLAASQGQDSTKMLKQIKELSAGTVSELELMQQANSALLLGLPVDRFGDMLKIARSSAKATGESMDFMLKSIVTGLGRGSKLMLDNLGILFKAEDANNEYAASLGKLAKDLTEAERKQAFINKALAVGMKNAKAAGMTGTSLKDVWEKLTANFANAGIVLGKQFGPALSFALEKADEFYSSADEFMKSNSFTTITLNMTRGLIGLISVFETVGKVAGQIFGSVFGAISQAVTGQFKQAWETIKSMPMDTARVATDSYDKMTDALIANDEKYLEMSKKTAAKKIALNQSVVDAAKEVDELKLLDDEIKKEEELARLEAYELATNDVIIGSQLARINTELLNETNRAKRLQLLKKKEALIHKAYEKERKKQLTDRQRFEEWINSNTVSNAQSVFSQIETLSSHSNSKLAAIGKAAGIASATINVARGITLALATFPPPVNFAMASLVGAAGAIQISKMMGVKLADGGIVKATEGGVPAIIGEGGRDEAVIPLDESGGVGGGSTFIFNGPIMGDESQAREFAKTLDEELLKLRQNNESVAFDEAIT